MSEGRRFEPLEGQDLDLFGRNRQQIAEHLARETKFRDHLEEICVSIETAELEGERRQLIRGQDAGHGSVGHRAVRRLRRIQEGFEKLAERERALLGLPSPAATTEPPAAPVLTLVICPRCTLPCFGAAALVEHLRDRHGLTEVESRTLAYAHGMERSGVEMQPTDSQSAGEDRLAPP